MKWNVTALAMAVAVAGVFVLWSLVGTGARAEGPTFVGQAVVTSQIANKVSVVDLASMTVVREIEVSGEPAGVALSPDRLRAYVTAPGSGELVVVDVGSDAGATGAANGAPNGILGRVKVGRGPVGVAVNPVSGVIYVADWYDHAFVAIDPVSLKPVGQSKVGKSPSGMAATPDGKFVLSADRDSDAVSVVEADTLRRIRSIGVGKRPFGLTIDAAGRFAYTANVKSNDVSVIDLATFEVVATVPVGERPYAVALAGGNAFVTDQYAGTVSVIDLSTNKVIKAIAVGSFPEGIAASADGKSVFVACWDESTLERISVVDLEVVGKVGVADGPRAFGAFLR